MSSSCTCFNQVYKFDHETSVFSIIPTITASGPSTRQDIVSWTTPDNTFHIFGGQSGDTLIVGQGRWHLDPISLQWFSDISEVHPSSRWGAVSCVTPTAAYIFGGAESSFLHADLWRFDFSPSLIGGSSSGPVVPITITQNAPSSIIQQSPSGQATETSVTSTAAIVAAIFSGLAVLILGVGFAVIYRQIRSSPVSV